MSKSLTHGKSLASKEDLEIDSLLSKLSKAELEELSSQLDPDNSLLPPSERCRDQTDKKPTGAFDKEKLAEFLEQKALNEKDWVDHQPYVKMARGKPFIPKTQPKPGNQVLDTKTLSADMASFGFEADIDGDIDEILQNASENELADLVGVLGFPSALTQEQIAASERNKTEDIGGFNAITKSTPLKPVPDQPPNSTDVEESIDRVKANSSELRSLNLNNISNISAEKFARLCEALRSNTQLESLSCANTHLTNAMAEPLIKSLSQNRHLISLNLESNFLTGDFFIRLLTTIGSDQSAIQELRLCNQRQRSLGVKVEQELTQIVMSNRKLRCLGVDLETSDARVRVSDHICRNTDRLTRLQRERK